MNKDFICEFDYPVVETRRGKIRGYALNGLLYFRGVPYATARRFALPEPVKEWEGILPTYTYGPNPPVTMRPRINAFDPGFQFRYWPEGENCQTLNIWTREINGSSDRPVIVWIHGGSLSFGSATELVGYEADRLAQEEDVVVVSVNHRLNLLGYMNLSEFGSRYADTGTLGQMDLIAALRWIQMNITAFGGNPDNVTVVGHSGGGAKVRSLMQMPEAEGLFSKAVIHSGIRYRDNRFRATESLLHDSAATAAAIAKELGLNRTSIEQIETLPYSRIAYAYNKVDPQLRAQGIDSMWSPVPDAHFPGDFMQVGLSDFAKRVPMIVGCTFGEMNLDRGRFYDRNMSEDELDRELAYYYGPASEEIAEAYQNSFPFKEKLDLLYLDSTYRIGSTDFLRARTEAGGAESFMFMLSYNFKMFGGFPAWHGSDLPLFFKSYNRIPVYNEPGAQHLGEMVSACWASFARKGKPKAEGLACWKPFSADGHETMIFDKDCFVTTDISYDMMHLHNLHLPPFKPVPDPFVEE